MAAFLAWLAVLLLAVPRAAYGASPVKRARATRAQLQARRRALYELVAEGQPMTVRHAYYRGVVAGLVPKTTAGYRQVQRDLAEMRKAGDLPFAWLTDNTRWMRKPTSYGHLQDAVDHWARSYRRDLWADAPERVELWCESDSIAGVLVDVTREWDVPLLPTKGYCSMSFAYSSAEDMNTDGRPVVVYYVGDHDPAGLDIEASLADALRHHLTVPMSFERIAVTWDQVETHDLPGTTPKKHYGYPLAVEAEALPAPDLRAVTEEAILRHVDAHRYRVHLEAERADREILRSWSERLVTP